MPLALDDFDSNCSSISHPPARRFDMTFSSGLDIPWSACQARIASWRGGESAASCVKGGGGELAQRRVGQSSAWRERDAERLA